MESTSTAAWAGPCELQLARSWTIEVAAPADDDDAQAWAPAVVGHPLQYGSIVDDIFGSSCSLQPYALFPASSYSSGGQQQQVVECEHNYYTPNAVAAARCDGPDAVDTYMDCPQKLFLERKEDFKKDAELLKWKMHRYPPSIQALDDWYTVPKVVAIGPYYHGRDHLRNAEEIKYVAAHYCIQAAGKGTSSRRSVLELYDAVVSAAAEIEAHRLYDKDVMEGIGYKDDFLPMMFHDACFLVMYVVIKSGHGVSQNLLDFFESNDVDITHDIMLLENQIPVQVVDAVIMKTFTADPPLEMMKKFIARWRQGFLLDRVAQPRVDEHLLDYNNYYKNAPHLLGFVRCCSVGTRRAGSDELPVSVSDLKKIESIPISAGAIELAEMGIFLAAKEKTELPDMGVAKKWIIFGKLRLAPLSLNDSRASFLVNMAALELCTTPDFLDVKKAEQEDSAVCSYLLLLCMLTHREEDVHELRTKGILRGAGLNDSNTLDFFTSLHNGLRKGPCYTHVMLQIQNYRNKRPWIKVYGFFYKNWKYIIGISTAVSGLIGIMAKLMSLRGAH